MNIKELVNNYYIEHRHDVLLSPYNALQEFAIMVAEWQKEQMMEEAICGNAYPDDKEIWCNLDKFPELEEGDKVRVIVLKKED